MTTQVSILILAAGASTRMKQVKQLLSWGDSSLLEHVVKVAHSSRAQDVYVVLGAHHQLIRQELEGVNASVFVNRDWKTGMGSSIATGVKGILQTEHPQAILILLCDQPLIDKEYINQLIDSFEDQKKGIIGTVYASKIGVPALFSAAYFKELSELRSDRGAWSIIAGHSDDCTGLDPKGKARDLDWESDYQDLHPKDL